MYRQRQPLFAATNVVCRRHDKAKGYWQWRKPEFHFGESEDFSIYWRKIVLPLGQCSRDKRFQVFCSSQQVIPGFFKLTVFWLLYVFIFYCHDMIIFTYNTRTLCTLCFTLLVIDRGKHNYLRRAINNDRVVRNWELQDYGILLYLNFLFAYYKIIQIGGKRVPAIPGTSTVGNFWEIFNFLLFWYFFRPFKHFRNVSTFI